jgi:hypothetical protein
MAGIRMLIWMGISLFVTMPRPALGPTHLPLKYWSKAVGAWSWPLASVLCRGWECVELYLRFLTCLHVFTALPFCHVRRGSRPTQVRRLDECSEATIVNFVPCSFSRTGHAVAQWLRHYAASRKVAGSSPDEVDLFLNRPNPFGRTMALGSTQPLTEMSTRNR